MLFQLAKHLFPRVCRPVRTMAQHRFRHVRYAHDAREERDFLTLQAVRVPAAIHPFVVMEHGERYPLDEEFLAAVAAMPEASGIALGFDRVVMLAAGALRVDQVVWTPPAGET